MNVTAKKKVEKDIEKIPGYAQELAAANIKILMAANNLDEIQNVERMKGTDEPYYRMKFNDYRFLLHLDEQNNLVTIRALTHRKDSYKKQNLPWRK